MATQSRRAAITRTPRPRDRKAQIIAVAGDLFYRHGYHNVGTEQIAQAVGITAGALYRHFAGKQDLLAHALIDTFERATVVVSEEAPRSLAAVVGGLAETAGARRDLGVLWNRETRHLDDERRHRMRGRFFAFLAYFTEQLHNARPELSRAEADLLSWCALAVLTSPSYHATEVDQARLVDLLRRMTLAVCTAPLTATVEPPASKAAAGLLPRARRESILTAAARLFQKRGYQSVSMEDIGAVVGMTGAGVYKYFDSKADLLSATIARAAEPLQLGLGHALASASTPAEGLSNALSAYIDFALVHHDLVGILVSEVMNLPAPERHNVRRAQHDYVAEWVRLLTDARPELGEQDARFLVHAVLTVVNDATRTRHLLLPALGDELRLLGSRILAVEV
jgi:AcrR family transcriptional regulator